jgi:hypothetical protein
VCVSHCSACMISGAIHSIEPQPVIITVCFASSSPLSFDSPKSVTFTSSSPPLLEAQASTRFGEFKSRWIILRHADTGADSDTDAYTDADTDAYTDADTDHARAVSVRMLCYALGTTAQPDNWGSHTTLPAHYTTLRYATSTLHY